MFKSIIKILVFLVVWPALSVIKDRLSDAHKLELEHRGGFTKVMARKVAADILTQGMPVGQANGIRWSLFKPLEELFKNRQVVGEDKLKYLISKIANDKNLPIDIGDCPICMDAVKLREYADTRERFSCEAGHSAAYHPSCMTHQTIAVCPMCRADIPNSKLIQKDFDEDGIGRHRLFSAVSRGSQPEVEQILARGEYVGLPTQNLINVRGLHNSTPLFWAARSNPEMAEYLLSRGASPTVVDANGINPLLVSAQSDNPSLVKSLIQGGSEVNTRGVFGETPLILATGSGNNEVVEALLQANADYMAQDQRGNSALMLAAYSGRGDLVRTLLDVAQKRGNLQDFVNLTSVNGMNAVDWAAIDYREIADLIKSYSA